VWNRAASVQYAGRVGVGCVVAPGVILTTRHVVEEGPGTEHEPRIVQVLGGGGVPGPKAHAEVAWLRGEAALLRCRPRDLGQEFTPVRFGELACTNPPTPPECSAIGLPTTALRRLGSAGSAPEGGAAEEGRLPGPESAPVRIDIVDNTSGSYGLHLDQRPAEHRPAQHLPQRRSMAGQGMSGAAVFCADLLMGMVTHGGGEDGQEQLEAVPARQLLEDRRFCDILQEASGTRPRLEAADLDGLFDGLPQQAAAASYFLSPHSEVVDFTGLDTELSTLTSWCNTGQSIDVAVVDGPGGAGKTRLGVELARRLSERRPEAEWQPGSPDIPWTAGFLSQTPVHHAPPYTMLRYLTRPALIVIDHAETRLEQIEQLLAALAGGHTPARPIRLLLLAHSSRGWWNQFQTHHPGHTTGVHISLETSALYRHHTPAQIQELAEISYSRRLVNLHRAGVNDDWDVFQAADTRAAQAATPRNTHAGSSSMLPTVIDNQRSILSVHMDALTSVLTGTPGELTDNLPATVTLLDHELTYIHRTTPTGTDPELITTLIALTGMTGIHTTEEAHAVIKTAWHHHHPTQPLTDDTLTHLTSTLTHLYPPPDGSPWTNPSPDALTTAHITHLETNNSNTQSGNGNGSGGAGDGFLTHVLPSPHLTSRQRHQALALVAHALADHPHLAATTAHAVTAHPLLLAVPATKISEQLPPPARDIWLTALRNAAAQRTHHPHPTTTTPPPAQGTAPATTAAPIPDPPPAATPAVTAAHPAHTGITTSPAPADRRAANNPAPAPVPVPTAAGPSPHTPPPPEPESWDINHSSTAQLLALITIPLTILITVLLTLYKNT
jgi:hypothetical protein